MAVSVFVVILLSLTNTEYSISVEFYKYWIWDDQACLARCYGGPCFCSKISCKAESPICSGFKWWCHQGDATVSVQPKPPAHCCLRFGQVQICHMRQAHIVTRWHSLSFSMASKPSPNCFYPQPKIPAWCFSNSPEHISDSDVQLSCVFQYWIGSNSCLLQTVLLRIRRAHLRTQAGIAVLSHLGIEILAPRGHCWTVKSSTVLPCHDSSGALPVLYQYTHRLILKLLVILILRLTLIHKNYFFRCASIS